MELEDQDAIKRLAEESQDGLLVLLGSPNPDSARIYAQTVTEGDPTWAGSLAGVSLRLPVYHILEEEVKSELNPEMYEKQVGILADALETEAICRATRDARERSLAGGGHT